MATSLEFERRRPITGRLIAPGEDGVDLGAVQEMQLPLVAFFGWYRQHPLRRFSR